MTDRGVASRGRKRWLIFSGVSTLSLVFCYLAVLQTGDATSAGLSVLGGMILVGIAAAFMVSSVSGLPDLGDERRGSSGSSGMGMIGGVGGSGGGDCGGGGGSC